MPNIAIIYSATSAHQMVVAQKNIDALSARNRSGEVRNYLSEEAFLEDDLNPEILIAWGQDTPERACEKMPDLKWIQSLSAGVEGLEKLSAAKRPGMILGKMKGVHGPVMAQTCLTYILCFVRYFPVLFARQKRHEWNKPGIADLRDAADMTVGIYGIGDIGCSVAKLCKDVGMRVLGCRRTPVPTENIDRMYSTDQLYDMLSECDFVVDLVPDTPQSKKAVNEEFFRHMKKSAVFINIGRGATVDTDALTAALQNGVIAGAALDAVAPEPLNEDSPLWDMENVIITPHCSADNPNYFDRAFEMIATNLEAFQDGDPVALRI